MVAPDALPPTHPYRSAAESAPLETYRGGPPPGEIRLVVYGGPPLLAAFAGLLGGGRAAIGFGILGVVAALLWRWKQSRIRDVVTIHEEGLRLTEGSNRRFLRWADVTELRSKVTRGVVNGTTSTSHYELTVSTPSEEVVLTRGFQGIERLGAAVHERVAEVLLPAVARQLRKGEKVLWSPLSLRRSGIRYGGDVVSWAAARVRFEAVRIRDIRFHALEFEEDDLVIDDERGEFCRLRVHQVPNAWLLPGIIAQMLAKRGAADRGERSSSKDGPARDHP